MIERPADACLETCSTCRFWRPERTVGDGTGWGQCRRMPPAVPEARDDRLALVGVWPHTDGRDWCGEWRAADGSGSPGSPR